MKKTFFLFVFYLFVIQAMEPPGSSNKKKVAKHNTQLFAFSKEEQQLINMGKESSRIFFLQYSKEALIKQKIKKYRGGYYSE